MGGKLYLSAGNTIYIGHGGKKKKHKFPRMHLYSELNSATRALTCARVFVSVCFTISTPVSAICISFLSIIITVALVCIVVVITD